MPYHQPFNLMNMKIKYVCVWLAVAAGALGLGYAMFSADLVTATLAKSLSLAVLMLAAKYGNTFVEAN